VRRDPAFTNFRPSGYRDSLLAWSREEEPVLAGQMDETPLDRVARIAEEAGAPKMAIEARALRAKAESGRFYVACVGQFKRGKSTLLDALIGEPLLPIGVLPVTSVPTVVCHGTERAARVRLRDGRWKRIDLRELEEYVSEAENPENVKQVSAVEALIPNPLLADGMCLVDTPGIASVFDANSAATREFIPHIDAAIVVIGADPPISGEELNLVQRIDREAPDLIFALNKADRVSATDRAAAAEFATTLLSRRLGRPIEVFSVSAKERLEGTGTERDWPLLTAALEGLASRSGSRLARESRRRGTSRLASWLLHEISEQREAVRRPIEESERRMEKLDRYIVYAEQSLIDFGQLLIGEEQRLTRTLSERRAAFLGSVVATAREQLIRAPGQPAWWGPEYRRRLATTAQDIARSIVVPWLASEREFAAAEYVKVRDRFFALTNDFLSGLVRSGVPEAGHLEDALLAGMDVPSRSRFQFHEMSYLARPASPIRRLSDVLLGIVGAKALILEDAENFLSRLLEVNASRVQADIAEQLTRDRQHLDATLRAIFQETKSAAMRTLDRVKATRSAGTAAVLAEVERLDELERELRELFARELGRDNPP
jgi:hypothetical protein